MVLYRSPEYQVVKVYNSYKYQMIKALLLLVSEKKNFSFPSLFSPRPGGSVVSVSDS